MEKAHKECTLMDYEKYFTDYLNVIRTPSSLTPLAIENGEYWRINSLGGLGLDWVPRKLSKKQILEFFCENRPSHAKKWVRHLQQQRTVIEDRQKTPKPEPSANLTDYEHLFREIPNNIYLASTNQSIAVKIMGWWTLKNVNGKLSELCASGSRGKGPLLEHIDKFWPAFAKQWVQHVHRPVEEAPEPAEEQSHNLQDYADRFSIVDEEVVVFKKGNFYNIPVCFATYRDHVWEMYDTQSIYYGYSKHTELHALLKHVQRTHPDKAKSWVKWLQDNTAPAEATTHNPSESIGGVCKKIIEKYEITHWEKMPIPEMVQGYVDQQLVGWSKMPYQDGYTNGRHRVYWQGDEVVEVDTWGEKPVRRTTWPPKEITAIKDMQVKTGNWDFNLLIADSCPIYMGLVVLMLKTRFLAEDPRNDPYRIHRLQQLGEEK